MLAVEDALDGLEWARHVGGLEGLIARNGANMAAIEAWVDSSKWAGFLAADKAVRSPTSVCLVFSDGWFAGLAGADKAAFAKRLAALLEEEEAAFDVGAYRDAPPGLRLWAGATVDRADIEALLPWLDWAYRVVKNEFSEKG